MLGKNGQKSQWLDSAKLIETYPKRQLKLHQKLENILHLQSGTDLMEKSFQFQVVMQQNRKKKKKHQGGSGGEYFCQAL